MPALLSLNGIGGDPNFFPRLSARICVLMGILGVSLPRFGLRPLIVLDPLRRSIHFFFGSRQAKATIDTGFILIISRTQRTMKCTHVIRSRSVKPLCFLGDMLWGANQLHGPGFVDARDRATAATHALFRVNGCALGPAFRIISHLDGAKLAFF
jgi:hypothetical protein